MVMELDSWQEEVMKTEGNICLRSGRQVGKSTVISYKAAEFAINNPNKSVMVIASVERQAQLLFEKILAQIYLIDKRKIKTGKDRPTKHKLQLKNGAVIHCLPTGESGYGIRGFTIDLLIADEADYINEDVWAAVTPMLAITKGSIWLLSTPKKKGGFFHRCFSDENYTAFHVSAEDCPRKDQAFLDSEKAWMTKAQYAQEYLGNFAENLTQFFSENLIRQTCIIPRSQTSLTLSGDYFLGVDIARMGEDESTFEILDGTNKERIQQIDNIITTKTLTTDTTRTIINLNNKYNFNGVGIDSGGMGAGVLDQLLETDEIKRKVQGLDNAKKNIDSDPMKPKTKRLIKEDMYNNLLRLMENKEIKLLDDDEIILSLRSIQAEYNKETGKLKIWGTYAHICEGLIRAAWLIKTKSLNPYIN